MACIGGRGDTHVMKQHQAVDGTVAARRADCSPTSLVIQGRLARVGGQNILFGSSGQAIFAINDTAADIWRSLEEGMPPEAISFEIARGGIDRHEADRYVEAALDDWERLGLIRPRGPLSAPWAHVSQMVAIAGLHIRIVYPAACAFPAATVFRHLEVQREAADVVFHLAEHRGRIHLFRAGDWVQSCSPDELPVMLKGHLLTEVLEHGAYELAVHAAALLAGARVALVCGNPGAGKTTLTMALVHAGFGFAADDVTLLDSNGRCVGLPFAPAVKAGAWPLLAEYCPDLHAVPIFRRPDRRRVRFAVPRAFAPHSPQSVGSVILLRRGHDAKACLEPVDPASALRGLLNGAFAPGRELTGTAFNTLAKVIGSAQAYCLNYSSLDDAVELIAKACR
ncbi:HPr kinase [Mesorhizobium sp. ORS 3324]|nr:HPr kinase [Mesorhizobium sp. ORS 3324]